MAKSNDRQPTHEELLAMTYKQLLELNLKVDLMDRKLENLQQDISQNTFLRSQLIKLTFDHKTDELYITEHFKIPFEGNEAVLLRAMFKLSNGLPKKSVKFYTGELAGSFKKHTDGLMTPSSVHATIKRIDATVKDKTMGLEIFKIKTKVFFFL